MAYLETAGDKNPVFSSDKYLVNNGKNTGHRIGDYKPLAGKLFLLLFSMPFCYVGVQFAAATLNTFKQGLLRWPNGILLVLCTLLFGGFGMALIWLVSQEKGDSLDDTALRTQADKPSGKKWSGKDVRMRTFWVLAGLWNLIALIVYYSLIDELRSLQSIYIAGSICLVAGLGFMIRAIRATLRWRKPAASTHGIDSAAAMAGMKVVDQAKPGTGMNRLRLGRWLLFGGILLAVPYYIYVKSFSGKEVGRFVLADRERMGTITFTGEGNRLTNQVGPIELGPHMNPLRVVLYVENANRSWRYHLTYTVSMVDDNGATVWEQSGKRGSKPSRSPRNQGGYINPKKNRTIALDPFNLEKAGKFSFLCTIHDKGKTKFSLRANLAVRKDVKVLNPYILVAGSVISLIGLVILMNSGKEATREYSRMVKEERKKARERERSEKRRIKQGEWGKWDHRTQIRRASPGQFEFCQVTRPTFWMGLILVLCGLDIAFFHISIPFRGLLPGIAIALAGILIFRIARGVVIDGTDKKIYRWRGLIRKPFIWYEDDLSRYETLEIDRKLGPKSGNPRVGRSVHYRLFLVTRDKKRVLLKASSRIKDARSLAGDISEITGLPVQDSSGAPPDKKRKPRKKAEPLAPINAYRGPQKLEDYVREHIVELMEENFPDNPDLEWTVHGFEYRDGMTIVEVEPESDETGYSRYKFVITSTKTGDVYVDATYCFKDGIYSLLCHSLGSGSRYPDHLD